MSKIQKTKLSTPLVMIIIVIVVAVGVYLAITVWPGKVHSPTKNETEPSATENMASNNQSAKVSSSQAEEAVRKFVDAGSNLIVEYDADSTDGQAWIIHVYEIVDNHTATYGWYEVNKQSGEIVDCTIDGCS